MPWAALAVAVVAVVVGAFVYEPWSWWSTSVPRSRYWPDPRASDRPDRRHLVVLARGELISHEHVSSGSVVVLRLADGSRVCA